MKPNAVALQKHIERVLRLFPSADDVVEVRALNVRKGNRLVKTVSGYFDDFAKAAAAGARLSGAADGVYFVLNQLNPALLARRVNRVDVAGSGETTSDRDIVRRRWLLVDCDAVRPAKISATDHELEATRALADRIAEILAGRGWPAPVRADSGNGAHLLYRIDLPPDDGGVVQRALEALARECNTELFKVDTSVHNPARITKLYGTLARKGDQTVERPWRLSACLSFDEPGVVSESQLLELAGSPPAARRRDCKANGVRSSLDLEPWVERWIPDARGPQPWSQGPRKWEIPSCPWNPDHDQGEAFVAELASGAIAAGCQHESCKWTWRDLRERLEPGCYDRPTPSGPDDDIPPPTDDDAPGAVAHSANGHTAAKATPIPLLASDILAMDRPPVRIYSTGFRPLDDRLNGGIPTRGMTVVCARPGAGKTGFALCLARHMAPTVPILYVSTELDEDESAARFAALELHKPIGSILTGSVPRAVAREAVTGLRVHVIAQEVMSEVRGTAALDLIRSTARALTALYGMPPIVFVDYLQQLAPDDDSRQVRTGVTAIARGLRAIAQAIDTAVFAVSTTGRMFYRAPRDAESADDPLYYLAAAKESGDVESSAVHLLFLDVATEADADGIHAARIAVSKARRGHIGFVGAKFEGACGSWVADDTLLGSMTASARAAKAVEETNARDEEVVLDAVRKHGPGAWRDLRDLAGVSAGRADKAKARLLAAKRLEKHEQPYTNARGSKCVRGVLQVPGAGAPDARPGPGHLVLEGGSP